jgi:hypothetical protein
MSAVLTITSGAIFGVLGLLHALYTFLDLRKPRRLGLLIFSSLAIVTGLHAAPPRALLLVLAIIGAIYVVLAARYWFRTPVLGTAMRLSTSSGAFQACVRQDCSKARSTDHAIFLPTVPSARSSILLPVCVWGFRKTTRLMTETSARPCWRHVRSSF